MKRKKVIIAEPERIFPDVNTGLSNEQVLNRIENGLTNHTNKRYSKSYLNIIAGNVCTFFNLLGTLVCIALILVDAQLSNLFFVVIYLANILIGITQEIRAKTCIDKLSLLSSKSCSVIRNGKTLEISSKEIVLDDIISFKIGSQIPTDSIIVSGTVEVNESLLTGESVAIKKQEGDLLLAGSFITGGHCLVRAEKVGKDNYVETLASKAKKYKKPHSELMSSLRFIIKIVSGVIVVLGTAFIIKGALMPDFDIKKTVLGTSTVMIGLIPSGMFLLTSVALAIGTIKLYNQNTLVQDLYSLEMLARVDTICFDKTGTITDGQMSVKEVLPLKDNFPYSINEVVSSMLGTLKDNNQTAIALYNYFGQNVKYVGTESVPFNSERKLSAVSFENMGTFSFGAPEFVLSEKLYTELKSQIEQYASIGLRVLVLANSDKKIENGKVPNDLFPIALILIEDNIRKDAVDTVKWFKDNDVDIKVISGDNPVTVSEVSRRVGINNYDKYISLEGLSDSEVYEAATKYTIFGRVSPEQKAIILKSLKIAGHTTAMTGDGVNDILALKEADCAITVASGSEAARNVSHLVLMDNNFNSMPKVVYEGRRVINNIQSSASLYLMKTLFTLFMGLIMLILPYMHTYPFSLNQMIMIEVFVIGLPSFFLSLQPNDKRVHGKFISYVLSKALPSAILMLLSVVVTEICRVAIHAFPQEVYTSMGVYSFTLAGVISLYNICKPFNKYRIILFAGNILAVVAIIFIGIVFGFPTFQLEKMWPIQVYWHHLLIVLCLMLVDIPLCSLFNKKLENVKILPKRFGDR